MLVCTLVLAMIIWILCSSLLYIIEENETNQHGSFRNMPMSLFITMIFMGGEWCRVDLTEGWGELVGVFIAILGIGIVGIPAAIYADNFTEITEQAEEMYEHKKSNMGDCCTETCNDMICWKSTGEDDTDSSGKQGAGTGSGRGYGTYGTSNPSKKSLTQQVTEGLAYEP